MAGIYDAENGYAIAEGLQGCKVCDEAIQMAERIADQRGLAVSLVDDDGEWLVYPMKNGVREPADLMDSAPF